MDGLVVVFKAPFNNISVILWLFNLNLTTWITIFVDSSYLKESHMFNMKIGMQWNPNFMNK